MWTLVEFFNWISAIVDWFRPPKNMSRQRWVFIYPLIIAFPILVIAFVIWTVEG